jgi:hypothetical protein
MRRDLVRMQKRKLGQSNLEVSARVNRSRATRQMHRTRVHGDEFFLWAAEGALFPMQLPLSSPAIKT